MHPHTEHVFTFRGFYDGRHHIVIAPEAHPDPLETIAHEVTHAKIVGNSSLGFVAQIGVFLSAFGFEASDASKKINKICERPSVGVHEAAAWLVTEIVSSNGSNARAPLAYRADVDRLRNCLEALADRPYERLEDCSDDFDPLFCSSVLLIQAIATYALSPPNIRMLFDGSPREFYDKLEQLISRDPPLKRFHNVLDSIEGASYGDLQKWTTWIRRWSHSAAEPSPVDFPGLPQHGGYLAKEMSSRDIAKFCASLTQRGSDGPHVIEAIWDRYKTDWTFDPHIDPFFQTCILDRPSLIYPFNSVNKNISVDDLYFLDYVVVKLGEEVNYEFKANENSMITLAFEQIGNKQLFLELNRIEAREFLTKWSQRGKGILVSSSNYDFVSFDLYGGELLRQIPHTVVAFTDARFIYLRIQQACQESKRSSEVSYIYMSSTEAPKTFGYLLLKITESSPLVIMPTLFGTAQRLHSLSEEIGTLPALRFVGLSVTDARYCIAANEPSIGAALKSLRHLYSRPENKKQAEPFAWSRTLMKAWGWICSRIAL